MAECKDVDKALANLARKIEEQNRCCNANKQQIADLNRRVRNLEQGGNKQRQSKPTDLTEVYKRLSAIESYINAFDSSCKGLTSTLQSLRNIFKF